LLEANMGREVFPQFKNGHIKHAKYFDIRECTEPTRFLVNPLPDKNRFQEYLGSIGVNNKHHLIVYDRSPFFISSRLWWMLRLYGHENISVLNGGLRNFAEYITGSEEKLGNWFSKGSGSEHAKETYLVKNERPELARNFSAIKEGKDQVIDVRDLSSFQADHIPNAKNIPFPSLLDEKTGKMKTNSEILEIFKANDVDLNQPLVSSCQTGVTACTFSLAAHVAAEKDVPVYYGSWLEYSQRKHEE